MDEGVVEALAACGAYPALGVRVGPRRQLVPLETPVWLRCLGIFADESIQDR